MRIFPLTLPTILERSGKIFTASKSFPQAGQIHRAILLWRILPARAPPRCRLDETRFEVG